MSDKLKYRSRLGDTISGYQVVTQYKEEVILAVAVNPNSPCKAVVWYLDDDCEPHTGDYYVSMESAYHEFISRAFGWYI